jgi:hypothetical protein
MSRKNLIASSVLFVSLLGSAQRQDSRPASQRWKPATFESLTIGRSTESDMVRVFGKPEWSSPPEHGVIEHWYSRKDPDRKIAVRVSRHVIREIQVDYQKPILFAEAIKQFGKDFQLVRVSADRCIGEESSPIYLTYMAT